MVETEGNQQAENQGEQPRVELVSQQPTITEAAKSQKRKLSRSERWQAVGQGLKEMYLTRPSGISFFKHPLLYDREKRKIEREGNRKFWSGLRGRERVVASAGSTGKK